MHIYEGGDSSTMQEHLKQIQTKRPKRLMSYCGLDHYSHWLCMAFNRAKW